MQIFKYHIKCESGSFGFDKKFYPCSCELTFESSMEGNPLPDGWGEQRWYSYGEENRRIYCPSCWLIQCLEDAGNKPEEADSILSGFPRQLLNLFLTKR